MSVAESIGSQLLQNYNKLLTQHPLYKKHLKAIDNWGKLRSQVKNQCSDCKIEGKTHLHHLQNGLRPRDSRSFLEIIYVPIKDIMYLHPDEIIENYLTRYEIEKSIIYFGVKWDEVIEVCPKCHRRRHSKNGI